MKNILIPIQEEDRGHAALGAALLLAERYNGHIEGLFVRSSSSVLASGGLALPGAFLAQMADVDDKLAAAARKRFADQLAKRDIKLNDGDDATNRPSASWREAEGHDTHVIAEHARLFDLTVIGRGRKSGGGWRDVCESALFESGRPVLVTGAKAPQRLGETVVIAWNGSTECARTVAFSMPLLAQVKVVHVIAMEAITVPGPSGKEMAHWLGRRGIRAHATSLTSRDEAGAGTAVLKRAKELGADLLIKSAYTQTRLRQIFFGGATRQILSKAVLPVLMAH